jgi:hypothetical protein
MGKKITYLVIGFLFLNFKAYTQVFKQTKKAEIQIINTYGDEYNFNTIDSIIPLIVDSKGVGIYDYYFTSEKNLSWGSAIKVILTKKEYIIQIREVGTNIKKEKQIMKMLCKSEFSMDEKEEVFNYFIFIIPNW